MKRRSPKKPQTGGVALMRPREDGGKEWMLGGKLHRDGDLPAVETPSFSAWYQNGVMHRDGGPAYVSHDNASRMFFKMGKKHRDGGEPAVYKPDGGLEWYENGELHRDNGPAIQKPDGSQQFWLRGQQKTLEEYIQHQMAVQTKISVQKPLRFKRQPSP